MQQLQQTPEQADVPQALADLPQPTSQLVGEDGVTMWLSFWAEVGQAGGVHGCMHAHWDPFC
jgi:hypothetical protein